MSDRASSRFATLPDGRRLAYRAVGPPDGILVLYLHGAIGSPQSVGPELEAIACELGIRYVMVSRPGFGGSDRAPGRSLLDFARDAEALADALGHERLAVVGVSAGGPYALACAHESPSRVAVASVVSAMTPGADGHLGLGSSARTVLRAVRARPRACSYAGNALLRAAQRHPRLVARAVRTGAPRAQRRAREGDAEACEPAAVRFLMAAGSGVEGMIDDHLACARPWGFRLEDVGAPVHVWHGLQDTFVPADRAMLLAAALPRARVAIDPDEGHFFYRRRLREILGELTVAFAESPGATAKPAGARRRAPG